jgi:hypothetical protein
VWELDSQGKNKALPEDSALFPKFSGGEGEIYLQLLQVEKPNRV